MIARSASLMATVLGLCWSAAAQPVTAVRVGDHPGFGRVVFDLPDGAAFDVVSEGERLLIVFTGAGPLAQPASLPRNVRALETGADTATFSLAPGAQARPVRLGRRLVVDVFDSRATSRPVARPTPPVPASAVKAPAPNPATEPLRPGGETPVPAQEADRAAPAATPRSDVMRELPGAAPGGGTTAAGQAAPAVMAAPVVAVAQEALPVPVQPAGADAAGVEGAGAAVAGFTIRTDADVGAAAFRRGAFGLVVLDRRIGAPSLPPGIEWTVGAVSALVRLPLPAGSALRLERGPTGWTIETVAAVPGSGLVPVMLAEGAGLPLPRPGRAVSLVDPLTGASLLVGTSLSVGAEAGVAEGRRTPDYALLPSWLGVAVEPTSDRVDLRVGAGGFVLAGSPPAALSAAGPLTRRFDLPDQPAAALLNRLQAHLAGAAAAAPRARTRDRVGAAQAMIGLGMGVEAQAVLQLAASEDPQAAADAELSGLAAVAAVLAGRPGEADGLDDPRLDGTDEIALWRGLRDRQAGRDTRAAQGLGVLAPLALSYPPTLQRLVWPDVAEAAVEGRVAVAADRLPPYAAARLLERDGQVDEAMLAFATVADGPDRLAQVKAGVRLAELRLASGRIGPADAAAALERQSIAWRGDGQEAAFLLRAAELRGAAGEWRAALDALRSIRTQFPDRREAVQARTASVMQAMLAAEGKGLSPVQLVLLAAEHADAMPEGLAGADLARLLAEKLAALDLPARAIPVLQGLVRAAPAGPARAEFGGRLAQMLLEGGDAAAAGTALEASAAIDLPEGLRESRGLVQSRVLAARGDLRGATAALFELGTAGADDLRATLLADAGDWRGSLSALNDLAAKVVPAEGVLPGAAQAVLLRQAGAAARAPDPAMLKVLEKSAGRMTGPRSDLFRVLTAAPLGTAQDLPRAARELSLARAVPQQLEALRTQ